MQEPRIIAIKANNAIVALVDMYASMVNDLQVQNASQQTTIQALTNKLRERSEVPIEPEQPQ